MNHVICSPDINFHGRAAAYLAAAATKCFTVTFVHIPATTHVNTTCFSPVTRHALRKSMDVSLGAHPVRPSSLTSENEGSFFNRRFRGLPGRDPTIKVTLWSSLGLDIPMWSRDPRFGCGVRVWSDFPSLVSGVPGAASRQATQLVDTAISRRTKRLGKGSKGFGLVISVRFPTFILVLRGDGLRCPETMGPGGRTTTSGTDMVLDPDTRLSSLDVYS